ncbi:MAG: DUF374 domain-containing protein [Candidatus Obscuribacterales bacterium]|nr:DUF374 domain-containing protein [Candidatus Obscuribacterales bacterium]
MARLFKTRELLSRYPWLDTVRMNLLGWICNHGTTFFDRSYAILKIMSPEAARLLEDPNRAPVTFAIYHGRMVGTLGLKPRKRLTILISQSRDGEMIARGAQGMGFSTARGSSKLGAVKGALELVEAVKTGKDLVFMVDGPRGPRFEVKPGIVRMAEITGTPIVPFICSARGAWSMPSWDKFMAASWGSPIVYIFGDPIYVPARCTEDKRQEIHKRLQETMEHLLQSADNLWSLPN